MDTCFSLKAKLYDTYRWDYPDEAISIIEQICSLDKESVIADFGAGTGILTKHFDNKSKKIYAIEPDDAMASILESKNIVNITIIKKLAHEVSEIQDAEVDIIVAGHALHWFDFEKTIHVFRRILKHDGFLVSVSNSYTSGNLIFNEIGKKLAVYIRKEKSADRNLSMDMYFNPATVQTIEIPFMHIQTFEELINGLSSASFYPDSNDGLIYEKYKQDLKTVFDDYQVNGKITYNCVCTVLIGKVNR